MRNPTKEELGKMHELSKKVKNLNASFIVAKAELDLAKATLAQEFLELHNICDVRFDALLDVETASRWVIIKQLLDGKKKEILVVEEKAKVALKGI